MYLKRMATPSFFILNDIFQIKTGKEVTTNMTKTGFIKTSDNAKIYYTEEGSGQPIIFIHGWSSSGEHSFSHIAARLKDKARCIYYDLRGHGRSYSCNVSSIGRLTQDLHDLIVELELKDVILVGHSLGGLIIYDYFQKYEGARVVATAVLDMSPKVLCSTDWEFGLRTVENPNGAKNERLMQNMVYDFMKLSGWQFKVAAHFASMMSPVPFGSVLYSLWLDMLDADFREGAKKINVPMRYFASSNGMYPKTVCDWLKEHVQGEIECFYMDGYDHFTMMMQGEYIATRVEDLLKKEPEKKSKSKKSKEVADKKE